MRMPLKLTKTIATEWFRRESMRTNENNIHGSSVHLLPV